ncbi:hypothetical protein PYW07_011806 [Mythimna separata]|uniref:RNA helicase n=1 Tax=Mythimna separata TaxID=271217 RepID=A0AAD8DK87_MYTSE|nr:hypothetical protein PYW07_011806 [Mythimna separata]
MDCVLKVERCEEWMPAASVAMKRCFLQAAEVWFSPTYVDKISTVFGDDTHKYGDIIIIKKNGEEVDLLQEIVNSDFAYEDEDLFDLKLRGNNPKTQLNYVTMHEVLKTIEDSYATRSIPKTAWLAALKKQPELHQKEKPLDSSPKAQKLDSSDPDNAEILSKEKLDYLKLCEDVDEISVGRGCSRNSLTSGKPSIVSVALKKKLEWLESQNIANRPKAIKPVSPTAHADTKTNAVNSDVNKKAEVLEVEENNNKISPKNGNLLSGGDKKNNKIKGKKPRQPVNNNETLVAYGPAGLQANKFTIKPWTPKIEKEEPVVEETRKPEPEPEIEEKKNEDVYANTDSEEDFSLDLKSLSTFVVDDCEHISLIYPKELKFCLLKVRDVVKNRAHKEWKVQYVIISRVWCDFMSSLARKAPDSVVCISAFEECVLYSKAATSVEFLAQESKLNTVINFLDGIDKSKKTVIVCRSDEEVKLIEKALVKLNYIVFACDSSMDVQELYSLDKTWKDYEEPVLGPILVCRDGNLTHMNITDASYLIHYSLPDLFSMFCKRFAVLIDNYPSIFKGEETDIKIKILLDSDNVEQLPKILQFIKSKEANRKLHGDPKVGDVCAVTLKQNLFVRCQVAKVLAYEKNRPTLLFIKLIDEERYEVARDTSLYYLPEDLKNIETYVVNVILSNLMPQDKDVTFSKLAENQLRHITEENDEIEMRGHIIMVVGNTIFVDTLEACQNLSSLEEVVVKSDFRKELLDGHAIHNPDHIHNLRKVSDFNNDNDIPKEKVKVATISPVKRLPKGRWAHLESGGFSSVFFISADSPSKFFVRPVKFDKCLDSLITDIQKHVTENPKPIEHINVGDIVIAEFPDDATPERARIDRNVKNNKVKCFFVDQGEQRDVLITKVYPITEKFITQLPFQAIECRLLGIKPFGENWTDFSTNFFADLCFDSVNKHKQLFTKYFIKEKAECTEGHKYGVVLIDTYSAEDVIINLMLVERDLAEENDEIELLNDLGFERKSEDSSDTETDEEIDQSGSKIDRSLLVNDTNKQIQHIPNNTSNNLLRSVPLIDSDSSMDDFEFITDDAGHLGAVPISEVVSIKELPDDTEWSDKVLASPVSSYVAPSSVTSSTDISVLPVDTTDSIVRPSDVASITDNLVRPSDVASKTDNFVRPSAIKTVSKPKLLWQQNKHIVTVKIKLIVDKYDLTIKERYIKFSAEANNTNYAFDFELYGVVNLNKSSHSNKGQYIQVKLWKVMATNWLTLTRHNELKKWIVYDVESIGVSSDEESELYDHRKNFIKNYADSDTDDNLQDDTVDYK